MNATPSKWNHEAASKVLRVSELHALASIAQDFDSGTKTPASLRKRAKAFLWHDLRKAFEFGLGYSYDMAVSAADKLHS